MTGGPKTKTPGAGRGLSFLKTAGAVSGGAGLRVAAKGAAHQRHKGDGKAAHFTGAHFAGLGFDGLQAFGGQIVHGVNSGFHVYFAGAKMGELLRLHNMLRRRTAMLSVHGAGADVPGQGAFLKG